MFHISAVRLLKCNQKMYSEYEKRIFCVMVFPDSTRYRIYFDIFTRFSQWITTRFFPQICLQNRINKSKIAPISIESVYMRVEGISYIRYWRCHRRRFCKPTRWDVAYAYRFFLNIIRITLNIRMDVQNIEMVAGSRLFSHKIYFILSWLFISYTVKVNHGKQPKVGKEWNS